DNTYTQLSKVHRIRRTDGSKRHGNANRTKDTHINTIAQMQLARFLDPGIIQLPLHHIFAIKQIQYINIKTSVASPPVQIAFKAHIQSREVRQTLTIGIAIHRRVIAGKGLIRFNIDYSRGGFAAFVSKRSPALHSRDNWY